MSWLQRGWALFRLPIVFLAIYLLREPIIDLIERFFDIVGITLFAINVLSTPISRIALAILLVAIFCLCAAIMTAWNPRVRLIALLLVAAFLLGALFYFTRTPVWALGLVLGIFLANLLPASLLEATPVTRSLSNAVVRIAAGFAELFLFRHYIAWVAGVFGWQRLSRWGRGDTPGAWLPAFVLSSLAAALLLKGERLVPFEFALRSGEQVEVIARGDFNWIQLDSQGQYLYVTGHGVPKLRRYDLRSENLALVESDIATGAAQSFAYDPVAAELYIYRATDGVLLYIDAQTMQHKRSVALNDLAPGDPWIVADSVTDTIAVVSEADVRQGHSFIVLRRASGEILDRRNDDPGNVLLDEREARLYLSYFRRLSGVRIYDLRTFQLGPLTPADGRADRMALYGDQLLLASPLRSRITRFDAASLEQVGEIRAGFGVRVMAVDEKRDLIVYGSLVTGVVHVAHGSTGKIRRRFYLGPWLRTIALHAERGVAYVSSNGFLYQLEYAHDL